jgi:hypothetical protein
MNVAVDSDYVVAYDDVPGSPVYSTFHALNPNNIAGKYKWYIVYVAPITDSSVTLLTTKVENNDCPWANGSVKTKVSACTFTASVTSNTTLTSSDASTVSDQPISVSDGATLNLGGYEIDPSSLGCSRTSRAETRRFSGLRG